MERLRTTTKLAIKDSHVPGEIRTEHLPNTRLEQYCYANRLNHREDGKCKACRNMRKAATLDEASL
jgi:hypothetical protein